MKYNLKNRPAMAYEDWWFGDSDNIEIELQQLKEWFEGFEAELREMMKDSIKQDDMWSVSDAALIKEILGE